MLEYGNMNLNLGSLTERQSWVVASSQIRTRVFENSSERKNYGITWLKGSNSPGSFIGLIGTQIPMYRMKKIGFNGSLQHLCKLIWFSYNTSY